MMKTNLELDDQRNVDRYDALLAMHGQSFRALDWGTRESQVRRFKVLAEIGLKSGDYVLDVGCGLADFYQWLEENEPGVNYSGIDITPAMASRAKERFPGVCIENLAISDLNLLPDSYDYLVASGIFFYRKKNPKSYLEKTVSQMFLAARKGIAFNTLSNWAKNKTAGEFYASPEAVLDFCRKLSPFVVLRHDYHVGDFTVYVYKSNHITKQ
jgi:SAM-dependent methyltransferase